MMKPLRLVGIIGLFVLMWQQPLAAAMSDQAWFKFAGRFHIVLLHLPIGILGLAILSSILRLLRIRLFDDSAQLSILFIGSLSALAAVVCGLMLAQEDGDLSEDLLWHMYTGIAVFVTSVLSVWTFTAAINKKSAGIKALYAASLLACGVSLVWSGHIGGGVTHGNSFLTKHAPWNQTAADAQSLSHTQTAVASQSDLSKETETSAPTPPKKQSLARMMQREDLKNKNDQTKSDADQDDKQVANSDDPMDDEAMADDGMNAMDTMDPKQVQSDMNPKNGNAQAHAQFFKQQVEPILAARCYECHGAAKKKGSLRLDSPQFIRAGGKGGAVIVAGQPERSSLYTLTILDEDDPDIMPPKGAPLSKAEAAILHKWILDGALFGDEQSGAVEPAKKPADNRVSRMEQAAQGVEKADAAAVKALEQAGARVRKLSSNGALLDIDMRYMDKKVDEVLPLLKGLETNVRWLDLARTAANDATLKNVASLLHLQRLMLHETKITDAGMKQIAKLKELEVLNLYACAITDKGLEQLKTLKSLQKIYLWRSKVTAKGVKSLQQALPDLEISHGN